MTLPKKEQSLYICRQCGFESRKWLGQCPDCSSWDALEEQKRSLGASVRRTIDTPVPIISDVAAASERLVTSIGELDRVLGGGIVPGSLVLIGGDPGIGKSTLILQLLAAVSMSGERKDKVLYVTGEESRRQIQLRAQRLGVHSPSLYVSTENCVETITRMAVDMRPLLLAIDSIQTMYSETVASAPGSVTQVREGAARLLELAKSRNISVLLVGHVTKDGAIAGPRVLEHMVDTVLYFEGDRGQVFRILRTVKNRFGATNEIGVFEMKEKGLAEVQNPSALFLAERPVNVPGSVVMPSIEGSRPILVEVQALVSRSSPGSARRTAIGADPQRLALLTAVLEKKLGLTLYDQDIFLNIAGGIRIDEPALDLGMVVALLSSFFEKIVKPTTVVCGEVGLAGEVRAVGHMDMRIRESARLGFAKFLVPASSVQQVREEDRKDMELVGVRTVSDMADYLFV